MGGFTLSMSLPDLGPNRVQAMSSQPRFQGSIAVQGEMLSSEHRALGQHPPPPPTPPDGGAGVKASEEKIAPTAIGPVVLKPLVNKAT